MEENTQAGVLLRRHLSEEVCTYLEKNVGEALTRGLTETINAQPLDAPMFLSRWLRLYAKEERRKLEIDRERTEISLLRASVRAHAREEEEARLKSLRHFDDEGLTKSDRKFIEKLKTISWVDSTTWGDVIKYLHKHTGATGVYVCVYEDEAAVRGGLLVPGLRYIHTDPAHTYMKEECLLEGRGITWDALQIEEAAEAQAQVGRSESDSEQMSEYTHDDQPQQKLEDEKLRKFVFVPDVMDEPRMEFWGLTKPGSFLAIPLVFENVGNPVSIQLTVERLRRSRKRAQMVEQKQKMSELAKIKKEYREDEGSEDSNSEAEPADSPRLSEKDSEIVSDIDEHPQDTALPSVPVKMVLCIDTLGKDDPLTPRTINRAFIIKEQLRQTFINTIEKAITHQAEEELDKSAHSRVSARVQELMSTYTLAESKLCDKRLELAHAEIEKLIESEEQKRQIKLKLLNEKRLLAKIQESEADPVGGDAASDEEISTDRKEEEESVEDLVENAPPLDKEKFIQTAVAAASHEAYTVLVLAHMRDDIFALANQKIPDGPSMINSLAACALLMGVESRKLRVNPYVPSSSFSWAALTATFTMQFIDKMITFDPQAPRLYEDPNNSLQAISELLAAEDAEVASSEPTVNVLKTWLNGAILARRRHLFLVIAQNARVALLDGLEPTTPRGDPDLLNLHDMDDD